MSGLSVGHDGRLPTQSFRERRATAGLEAYVSSVWVQQVAPHSPPYTHRTVPNGSAELVCKLGSLPRVIGPQTGPRVETLAAGTTVVGVRLKPGAVASVLGVPACDLVARTVGSDDLWSSWADELGERLAAANTPEVASAVLERAVFARVATTLAVPDAVAAAAAQQLHPGRGASDVSALAASLHISERQLRRRCRTAIGFAPKTLQRMLRFHGFLALARDDERSGGEGLARLAAEAGYADQAHLTRESIRLAGQPPRVLIRGIEKQCGQSHHHAVSHRTLRRSATTI